MKEPLYLNPHAWDGLPADQVFQLHRLRVDRGAFPSDKERNAILQTVEQLRANNKPKLLYVYELDNFKERFMNNDFKKKPIQKLSNTEVVNRGATPHEQRRNEHLHRVAAYEMPLLAKYRQQYQPTGNPLKITYKLDFSDDAAAEHNRHVSLAVKLEDLKLLPEQTQKFLVLAGEKFSFADKTFRLKTARFGTATQNAKWLVERFNALLAEAKDLSKETFADIPVDTRHSKAPKQKLQFPEEWKRPQDAPVEKNRVSLRSVHRVLHAKDLQYLKKLSPL